MMLAVEETGAIGRTPRHVQLIALPRIADIGRALQTAAGHSAPSGLFELEKELFDIAAMQSAGGVITHPIGQEHAQGGERACHLRNDHRPDAEFDSDLAGMQSAATA